MQLFRWILCIVLICVSGFADAINFRDCGSTNVVVTSVNLLPCDSDPCTLVKGTSVTIHILFRGLARIFPGDASFEGSFDEEPATIPFPPNGVCRRLIPGCPIQPGQRYTYHYTAVVPEDFRTGLLRVEWRLLNANMMPFLCVEFLVRIAEAP
ncbi:hypothetical protein CRM22_002499 [Opisthorchis felineus]|uniref:MD-2-related lipid-recognition domain-containing protein n=1 Tax=Opisthorchis felineus TaxID=147828 RepID=A0A4S2M5R4_OPIFE|nr:hypothetical protein CRM22_002499 [Opisthorchis felineus]